MDGEHPQPADSHESSDQRYEAQVDVRSAVPAETPLAQAPIIPPAPIPAESAVNPETTPVPSATTPPPAVTPPTAPAESPYAIPEAMPPADTEQEFTWTGPEFIEHAKTTNWYMGLVGATVLVLALAWLFSKDIITEIAIIICAALFGVMAARAPREMKFCVDSHGITIGPKQYPWSSFKSFAVIDEGAVTSIDFLPVKRFSVPLSIYYNPEYESQLLGVLSAHLPFADHRRTWIDVAMHKVHF